MKRLSSLRATRAPIISTPIVFLPEFLFSFLRRGPLGAAHRLGRRQNCLHDVVVAGAAADVALELVADGLFVELSVIAADHVDGGHDHARRAEAALQSVMLAERR